MLTVKLIDSKEFFTVYEVNYSSPGIFNNTRPLFLVYKNDIKKFTWLYVDCFKPYSKELFKIVNKDDRRIKSKVYAVHLNNSALIPACYLIYKNKTWDWVYADEYEIISPNEL